VVVYQVLYKACTVERTERRNEEWPITLAAAAVFVFAVLPLVKDVAVVFLQGRCGETAFSYYIIL